MPSSSASSGIWPLYQIATPAYLSVRKAGLVGLTYKYHSAALPEAASIYRLQVSSPRTPLAVPAPDSVRLTNHPPPSCLERLAGYKVPNQLFVHSIWIRSDNNGAGTAGLGKRSAESGNVESVGDSSL